MVKQVFLHIGGEKTGTTTLQHFLTLNARQLRRIGFYYPCEVDNICFENNAHFPVAACLIDAPVDFLSGPSRRTLTLVPAALARIVSAAKGAIVLSCEHFSSRVNHTRQIKALREALRADEIKVIYYAREPSDLALAAWSTSIRSGARGTFDVNAIAPENRYYNHLETLNLWGSVFGESNLIVREYNRTRFIDCDIRKDFCALLGIPSAGMRLDEDENQSFDAQRLEALRYINCALPEFRESEIEWRRAQNLRHIVSMQIPEGRALKTLISERDRALIKARFSVVHRELNNRYFSGQLSRCWFPDGAAEEVTTDLQNRCNDDLTAVLRETIIRLAEAKGDYGNIRMRAKKTRMVNKLWRSLRQRFLNGGLKLF